MIKAANKLSFYKFIPDINQTDNEIGPDNYGNQV